MNQSGRPENLESHPTPSERPPAETPLRLLFATRNPGKLAELRELMADTDIEVISLDDLPGQVPEVVEDGHTFEANAAKKAREVSRASGLPALADDSGLEVDALDGAPGVFSARYAGEHANTERNNAKLIHALREIPDDQRGARFRAVLAFAHVHGRLGDQVITTSGACEGRILRAPRGTGGFGYDPLFLSTEAHATFAELDVQEKNRLSHRARAMAAMKPQLTRYFHLANVPKSR